MITIQPETNDKTLVVTVSNKLTAEDYETVFMPKLEELLAKHGKIKAVMHADSSFEGWELGAAWDDATFGMKHRNDFEKIALVGMPQWVEWGTKLAEHFISGEIKFFDSAALQEAIAWTNQEA